MSVQTPLRGAPMHDIEVEFDVPVPMRDGTVLRADIYRPSREGEYPVLLARGPYEKGLQVTVEGLMDSKTMVKAGYVVIMQDTRGRFASEGEWLPWKCERDDGYDTVEWAASLPYSNGVVGMYHGSYLGGTQWSAAVSRPPHLSAIAPFTTWSDPEDGLMFRGGAIELGLNSWWALMSALGQLPKAGLGLDEMMTALSTTMRSLDALTSEGIWELPS